MSLRSTCAILAVCMAFNASVAKAQRRSRAWSAYRPHSHHHVHSWHSHSFSWHGVPSYGVGGPYAFSYSYYPYHAYSPVGPSWCSPHFSHGGVSVYLPAPVFSVSTYSPAWLFGLSSQVPSGAYGPAMTQDPFFPDPTSGLLRRNPLATALRRTEESALIEPSAPAAQIRSVRFQAQGDEQLAKLNYLAATDRYRQAIKAAPERVSPHYRLAVTLAARSKFEDAIDAFKRAVALNPQWPQTAPTLDELLGGNNMLEKTLVKQRSADWLLRDVRSPDRLFLLGVLLSLDQDPRSRTLLDTAIRLAGPEEHLMAFLTDEFHPVGFEAPASQIEPDPIEELEIPSPNFPKDGDPDPLRHQMGPLLPPLPE